MNGKKGQKGDDASKEGMQQQNSLPSSFPRSTTAGIDEINPKITRKQVRFVNDSKDDGKNPAPHLMSHEGDMHTSSKFGHIQSGRRMTRCNSLPGSLQDVHTLMMAQSRRSPSANVIKKEFRYAALRHVNRVKHRGPPLSTTKKGLLLDPDVLELLVAHSKRSPSANIIKKEFPYASLRKVKEKYDHKNQWVGQTLAGYQLLVAESKQSPCASIIKKEFPHASLCKIKDNYDHKNNWVGKPFLDPDVYQTLMAQSRRSPSANIIKKEFRYARLRSARSINHNSHDDDDETSLSTISTLHSSHVPLWDDLVFWDDDDVEYDYETECRQERRCWLENLQPILAHPTMFPYYESSGGSTAPARSWSGSTLATTTHHSVDNKSLAIIHETSINSDTTSTLQTENK